MADATYQPYVYRKQGSTEFVVASGGKINMESGATLTLTGQAVTTTGAITGDSFTSTGGTVGSGKFNSVTSTGTGTFNAVTSTGTGTFNAVTSTGTGTFNAVTSTGIITGDSFTSTGGTVGSGKFNSVTSTGTGTFNAVTSTGTGTFNAVTSTGTGTFNAVTSTGTGTFNAVTSTGTGSFSGTLSALGGFKRYIEAATSSWSAIATNYGITRVRSTEDAEHVMSLVAPTSGIEKFIVCDSVLKSSGVSTGAAIVTSSGAGAAYGAYTSILFTTGAVNIQWVHLVGENSTNWWVVAMSTDVTLSAT